MKFIHEAKIKLIDSHSSSLSLSHSSDMFINFAGLYDIELLTHTYLLNKLLTIILWHNTFLKNIANKNNKIESKKEREREREIKRSPKSMTNAKNMTQITMYIVTIAPNDYYTTSTSAKQINSLNKLFRHHYNSQRMNNSVS